MRLGRNALPKPVGDLHALVVEPGARCPRSMVGHKRGFTGRLHHADIGEMIAVTLGGEMLDASAQRAVAQIRILLEARKRRLGRPDLCAARPPPGTEMRHGMHGIQKRLRVCAGKDRDRHGTTNIGRMHAGMDCFGRDCAADRDRSNRTGRASVRHDRCGPNNGCAHQRAHRRIDLLNVVLLKAVLGADIGIDLDIVIRPQGKRRPRLEALPLPAHPPPSHPLLKTALAASRAGRNHFPSLMPASIKSCPLITANIVFSASAVLLVQLLLFTPPGRRALPEIYLAARIP
ncbi:hypothetical protein ACVIEM_005357 [Rhizobium leguminosarum]